MKKGRGLLVAALFLFALGSIFKISQARAASGDFAETHRKNISDGQPDLSEWVHGQIEGGQITENGVIPQIEETIGVQLGGMPTEEGGPTSGGVMGGVAALIGSTYSNPPASGVYYAYDVLHRLGAVPAYAAPNGIGFSGLQPILPIWKAFRNIAYTIFAIAMLVSGLMIMFRIKISPQAVLTLENALPRMIGTLILITFSYAIAGFMIDLMYVVMALSISILGSSGVSLPGLTPTSAIHSGFFTLVPGLGIGVAGAAFLGASIGYMVFSFGNLNPIGGLLGGIPVGMTLMIIIWLIIAVFQFFKLLLALIKAYIGVITSVIFAPILIATGVIPGQNPFGNWLKGLAANLLAFPGVLIILMIGSWIIMNIASVGDVNMWYPPLMGPPDINFLQSWVSGFTANVFVKSIIGMGFLFVLPKVPDIIKKAMGVEDSGIGALIGQAFSPAREIGKFGMRGYAAYRETSGVSTFAPIDKLTNKYPSNPLARFWNRNFKPATSKGKASPARAGIEGVASAGRERVIKGS